MISRKKKGFWRAVSYIKEEKDDPDEGGDKVEKNARRLRIRNWINKLGGDILQESAQIDQFLLYQTSTKPDIP